MKQTFYERIGESVYREVLPNGLQVCVVPKPEHAKKYAFFATRYGGMDTRFCLDGKWLDTPAGIAHYLEHKMFDTKEGNALQELAKNGAEPNAFTSNAMTGYYFDSTEHFEGESGDPAVLRLYPLFHGGERGQGAGHHRPGDPHDRGQPRLATLHPDDAGPVPEEHCPHLYRRDGGEYLPHHSGDAVRLPQGILHPLQHDFDSGGQRGSGPCGGPGPADPTREGGPAIPRDYGQEPAQVAAKETRMAMEVSAPQFLTAYKVRPGGGRGGLPPYRRSGRHGLRHPAGGFQPPVPAAL